MLNKKLRGALVRASVAAMAAAATPAAAQQVDRIVAFGDSYADTGNAFALGYANPAALTVVDVTAEHEFSGDGRLIRFAQTDAPGIVNQWEVTGDKQTYGRGSIGASADVWRGIGINVSASSTFGRDGGQEVSGQLGVKAQF